MRLDQILNENPDKLRKTLDAVRRECSDYLKEVARSGVFIYRGSKTREYEGFYRTYPKGDRLSRDSTPIMNKIFQRVMGEKYPGYENIRQSATFGFLNGLDKVGSYGHPYAMFPQNGSEYVSLKGVDDYTVLMSNYIRNAIIELFHDMQLDMTDQHMIFLEALHNEVSLSPYIEVFRNPDDYSLEDYDEAVMEVGVKLDNFTKKIIFEKTADVNNEFIDAFINVTDITDKFNPELVVSRRFLSVANQLDNDEEILVTGNNGYYMISWWTLYDHAKLVAGVRQPDIEKQIAQMILDGHY